MVTQLPLCNMGGSGDYLARTTVLDCHSLMYIGVRYLSMTQVCAPDSHVCVQCIPGCSCRQRHRLYAIGPLAACSAKPIMRCPRHRQVAASPRCSSAAVRHILHSTCSSYLVCVVRGPLRCRVAIHRVACTGLVLSLLRFVRSRSNEQQQQHVDDRCQNAP